MRGLLPNAAARRAFWLPACAGLLAVMLVAGAGAFVAPRVHYVFDADESRPTAFAGTSRARARPPQSAAAAADIESLRRLRSIAAEQLRKAEDGLSACPSPTPVSRSPRRAAVWMACARTHVAHLDLSSRLNASIFYSISQRLPIASCQQMALGRSNEMRLLADAAHLVQSAAGYRSRAGLRALRDRIVSLRGFVRHLAHALRRPDLECGRTQLARG